MDIDFKQSVEMFCQNLSPIAIKIGLTRKCFVNCIFCIAKKKATPQTRSKRKSMPIDVVDSIIDSMPPVKMFHIGMMGEDTLSPHLVYTVKRAKEKADTVELVTNGILLQGKLAEDLIEAGLDFTIISVNATEADTYKFVTSVDAFESVTRNIKYLSDHGVRIRIAATLFQENYDSLLKLGEYACECGAHEISVNLLRNPELFVERGIHLPDHEDILRFYTKLKQSCDLLGIANNFQDNIEIYEKRSIAERGIVQFFPKTPICHFPFSTIMIAHDLSIDMCCGEVRALENKDHNINVIEYFNSPYFVKVRKKLILGPVPRQCRTHPCYFDESISLSKRLSFLRSLQPDAYEKYCVEEPFRRMIKNKKLLLWCATEETRSFISRFLIPRENIVGIMDRKGKTVQDRFPEHQVIDSSNIKRLPEHDMCVIINTLSKNELKKQAINLQAKNVINYVDYVSSGVSHLKMDNFKLSDPC